MANSSAMGSGEALSSGPSIGVVMTCYNEGLYIGQAVRSVLNQTRSELVTQIVIADDGSNEATTIVLKDIEAWDPRIKVLYGPGGAGLPAQRNRAAREIDADWLAILDGDDFWVPEKLERQLPATRNPDVGLIYSGLFLFNDGASDQGQRVTPIDITDKSDLVLAYFQTDPPIFPTTILMRRTAFEACGRFDAHVRVFEDTDIYLRILKISRAAFIPDALAHKRYHRASITGGRKDLMAHHAFVAFKAASVNPELLPLVPARLSERARKLGNQKFLLSDRDSAIELLSLAIRLRLTNRRAWISYLAVRFAPALAIKIARKQLAGQRDSISS